MYTVVRQYSGLGASELAEQILAQADEVESEIRSVTGVISYDLVMTTDGCISITVCEDKEGADESVNVAAAFVSNNCTAKANPPVVSEGETIIHFRV